MEEDTKGSQSAREVVTSSTEATCETLTKEGKRCRRKRVLGTQSCRGHLKWEGECSICLEEFPNRELKCGHRFHRKCFERWKETVRVDTNRVFNRPKIIDVTCPLCRSVESKRRLYRKQNINLSSERDEIDTLSHLLQMLFPFPSQMINQMAENIWMQIELDSR